MSACLQIFQTLILSPLGPPLHMCAPVAVAPAIAAGGGNGFRVGTRHGAAIAGGAAAPTLYGAGAHQGAGGGVNPDARPGPGTTQGTLKPPAVVPPIVTTCQGRHGQGAAGTDAAAAALAPAGRKGTQQQAAGPGDAKGVAAPGVSRLMKPSVLALEPPAKEDISRPPTAGTVSAGVLSDKTPAAAAARTASGAASGGGRKRGKEATSTSVTSGYGGG